jgi:hypothetical protein
MVQKNVAMANIYVAPLVKWHNRYDMLMLKAENYDKT